MSFEIIPAGERLHDLMYFVPFGEPEFIGRFDNKVRAWMAAKDFAAKHGISAGDAPWMRLEKPYSAAPRSF